MEFSDAVKLHQSGRPDLAEAACRAVVQHEPGNANAWHLLGMLLLETGRRDEALESLNRSIVLRPSEAQFHSNLSAVLGTMRRYPEALASAREAARLDPSSPKVQNNLGVTLERCKRFGEAAEAFRRAAACDPGSPLPLTHLGNVLRKTGRYADALAAYRRAIQIKPTAHGHSTLAACYADVGEQEQAIAARRKAVELAPNDAATHSDLLLDLLHDSATTPQLQLEESLNWARRHAELLIAKAPQPTPREPPDGRLRIGYVSADFREHPVSRFFEPVLTAHDRARFKVFCYSASRKQPDATTQRLQSLAEHWREISALSDDQAADRVRSDGIHILVDLGGHTGSNRLLLFARRPAPVQVSYLGYPATTGMSGIQYRITDAIADPPGAERFYTEQLVRLPGCAWCYGPSLSASEVGSLPADAAGHVTFVALHRQQKITPLTLDAWAAILRALPSSRLLVSCRRISRDDHSIPDRFARLGIDSRRLELVGRGPHDEYLRHYLRADIALDAYPYNGTTTTCDALWMGVPVVTLRGDSHVARTSASLLGSLSLRDLVASTVAEYVQLALTLAADRPRLRELRSSLRTRMSASRLMDAPAYTRRLETAYLRFSADIRFGSGSR